MAALAELSITPEAIAEIKRSGSFRPNYKPETPPDKLRQTLTRELVTYVGESYLEITGYNIRPSEIPSLTDSPIEQETWSKLSQNLDNLPIGTSFVLQSPKWSWWGYNKEVWYAGSKTGEDQAYIYDIRLPLPAEAPPISLKVYTRIHDVLSLNSKIPPNATRHELVRNPIILAPQADFIDRFIDIWAQIVHEEEGIRIDTNQLKQDIANRVWEKEHEEYQKRIPQVLVDNLMRAVFRQDEAAFIHQMVEFERMMGLQAQGSCGAACMLLAQGAETKQPYLTDGKVNVHTASVEARKCEDCKKLKSQCNCRLAKAA